MLYFSIYECVYLDREGNSSITPHPHITLFVASFILLQVHGESNETMVMVITKRENISKFEFVVRSF